ncbi:MAG: Dyp-type peroxidase [Azospirillaceae bacterium]|nr:Dyp-type peroxidase [Azospirillaceae bacterium]
MTKTTADSADPGPNPGRRGFLAAAGGLVAAAGAGFAMPPAVAAAAPTAAAPPPEATPGSEVAGKPFHGEHQAGIVSPAQGQTYFAVFDLVTPRRSDVEALFRTWTDASARMARGDTAKPLADDLSVAAGDGGEAIGLPPARLTITFGFGAGLFTRDGQDRYGLAAQRPAALVDMPRFNGDQLEPAATGGDLSVQACADDPQVAFHAIRQLVRLAEGVAQLRWTQTGFNAAFAATETGRNLMGFKDGTQNPQTPPHRLSTDPKPTADRDAVVWVGDEGPDWMRGGSYVAVRLIRIALEHWDRTEVDFQEQVVGRHKHSGAPLGGKDEFDPLDLDAVDQDGNPVIPENAHVRLGAAAVNDGAQILRRAFSFNNGIKFTAERWPPWRQGLEYDAGLLFVAYQRDLRTGFIKIFEPMAKLDAMNQFTTHVGGGFFACPRGIKPGEFLGQDLFKSS